MLPLLLLVDDVVDVVKDGTDRRAEEDCGATKADVAVMVDASRSRSDDDNCMMIMISFFCYASLCADIISR